MTPGDQFRFLVLSDERDLAARRQLELEGKLLRARTEAFCRGYRAGYCRQYGDSIPWDQDVANALVAAAENWTVEQAELRATDYIIHALAVPPDKRTEAQAACLKVQRELQDRERRLWAR